MRTLTLEQRAKRAAKRRNSKVRRKYPLFAEQWLTTPEHEMDRLRRQEAAAERMLASLREAERAAWQRGMRYRELAREMLVPEVWKHWERLWHKVRPHARPEVNGFHLADWWRWALCQGKRKGP